MIQNFLSKGVQHINRLALSVSAGQMGCNRSSRAAKILFYLNLPQDLDMLLPLIARLKENEALPIDVSVSDKAWKRSPRIGHHLSAVGVTPQIISHKAAVAGLQPSIHNVCAVITASESSANPHRGAHTLTQKANQKGILTYTMQHGYENVGITYFDEEYPVGMITFASQKIFTWVPAADIPAQTPAQTRQKCIAVGCPKFVGAPELNSFELNSFELSSSKLNRSKLNRLGLNKPRLNRSSPSRLSLNKTSLNKLRQQVNVLSCRAQNSRLVTVFENLHWGRYSDEYRQQFLTDLAQTARAHPHVTFLVKPHHTGLWLTKRYQGNVPAADNLIIADPQASAWEMFTAPALIEIADAVITTPSTVAIDAVRANCRVAVTAYGMALPNYAPLPLLRSAEDWRSLILDIEDPSSGDSATALTSKFAIAHLIAGDAVQKIIDTVTSDLSYGATLNA
ncbi:MAG: hypothetical protein AAF703_05185 [Cyanobacteria bacterium P01_D01_bin.105]